MDPNQLFPEAPSDFSEPCTSSRYTISPMTHPTSQPCCKKHPGKISCYFISQEPWITLCEKCALNMALCGKKIERRLTEEERKRKLELEGIVFEFKSKAKVAEEKEVDIKAKIATVEGQYLLEVENLLRFYDSEIEEWTRKRNEVYKVYSEEILDYFKVLEDVRYRFSLANIEFKNSLQNIQNNFVTMIHDMPTEDFNGQITQYRKNLEKVVENQDKIMNFDKKKEAFGKLVKDLITKTEAFKNSKIKFHPHTVPSNQLNSKLHLLDGCDSRKFERSITPTKKINIPILQDQNFLSVRDEEHRLKLKPTGGQATSKSKLTDRSKRTNSKLMSKKDDFQLMDIGKLHRA